MKKSPVKVDRASLLTFALAIALIVLALTVKSVSATDRDQPGSAMSAGQTHLSQMRGHQHHRQHKAHIKKTLADYHVPPVYLKNQDGERVFLPDILASGKPIVMNFIFTSCSTLCPVMTATFAKVQKTLKNSGESTQFVSVSIDPNYDTPVRLSRYAAKYGVTEGWEFLTGDLKVINEIQRAFHAFRGNKMNHAALTFMHLSSAAGQWLRIDGSSSASQLLEIYRQFN